MNRKTSLSLLCLQDKLKQNSGIFISENLLLTALPDSDTTTEAKKIIAEYCKNLLILFVMKLANEYPSGVTFPARKQKILQGYRNFFIKSSIVEVLTSPIENDDFIRDISRMPAPPKWFSAFYITIHQTLGRLAAAYEMPEVEQWKELYLEVSNYQQFVTSYYDQMIDSQTLTQMLNSSINVRLARSEATQKRHIAWGRELYQYYLDEKEKGLSHKAAIMYSRRHFRKKHPEIDKDGIPLPGLSSHSLLRYLKTYQRSMSE